MDNSLKELESQLESLVPRGLSDAGEESCSALIDELAAGKISDLSPYRPDLSWKAGAVAASIALAVGLGSGWWLGRDAAGPNVAELEPVSEEYLAGFAAIEHPVEILSNGVAKVYVDPSGEVFDVRNEVEVKKETIRHLSTNYVITWSKVDSYAVEEVKSQF